MFKQPLSQADNTVNLIKASGILRAYKEMGYEAVAVSAGDLTAGMGFFLASMEDSFPWVSANIFNKNKKLIFPPHIIRKTGSITVGIIGLTGSVPYAFEDITIEDWRSPLSIEIKKLKTDCDMLMVLSSLSEADNRKLTKEFPQIDLIVTANRNQGNISPRLSDKSILSQGAGRGKYLGQLHIKWHPSGKWLVDQLQSSSQLENKLSSLDQQITQLEKQQTETSRDNSQKIDRMRVYRKNISDQIILTKEQESSNEGLQFNTFISSFLPIKPASTPGNIETIVQDTKKSVNAFNRHRQNTLKRENPVFQNTLQVDEIAGFISCRDCHEKQTAFWQNTAHADAFTTLSNRSQSFNLECLPCHVTAGKVTPSSPDSVKLYLLSLDDSRRTIGCEVCHGPAKKHILSPESFTPERYPSVELCIICHTKDRDEKFDYSRKLPAISCPAN